MKAFTLVELLVSITIVAILAAMSISAYPKFSEQIMLTGETYKMLAYLKETQSYGVSAITTPGTKVAYAFMLEKSTTTIKRVKVENPTSFTNQYYITSATEDLTVPKHYVNSSYEIFELNGYMNNATTSLDVAYAFFRRPNPESRITGKVGTNISPDVGTSGYSKLEICLRSKKNNAFIKKVVILQTGQMYVADW